VQVSTESQGVLKCSRVIRCDGVHGGVQSSVTVLLRFGGDEAFSTSSAIKLLNHPINICPDT
jgi:hypothetical protein